MSSRKDQNGNEETGENSFTCDVNKERENINSSIAKIRELLASLLKRRVGENANKRNIVVEFATLKEELRDYPCFTGQQIEEAATDFNSNHPSLKNDMAIFNKDKDELSNNLSALHDRVIFADVFDPMGIRLIQNAFESFVGNLTNLRKIEISLIEKTL